NSGAANDLYAVAFGNGKFVATGLNGQLALSTDGSNWAAGTNASVGPWWITFGNGVFVAAGPGGSVKVSADGQNWASNTFTLIGYEWPHALHQVEYGNGTFAAVVSDETDANPLYSVPSSHFYTSTDGTNWTQKSVLNWGPDTAGGP